MLIQVFEVWCSRSFRPEASTVAVVDVRDDDFAGGHIKGALNVHSEAGYLI